MAQHDQVIDNGSGLTVRTDMNAAFAALFSTNSGPIEPTVIVPGQLWFDTSQVDGSSILWQRNPANTAWFQLGRTTTTAADLSYGMRVSPDSFYWNDNITGTGLDLMTLSDTGDLAVLRDITAGRNIKGAGLVDPVFKPSGDLTKSALLDLSAITTATQRIIRVPNMDSALGKWEPIGDFQLSAASQLVVQNLGAFRKLRVSGSVIPSATAFLGYQFSLDNGTTWKNGGTDHGAQSMTALGTTVASSAQANSIAPAMASCDLGIRAGFFSDIEEFNQSGLAAMHSRSGVRVGGQIQIGNWYIMTGYNGPRNALRVLPNTGTITGWISIEGWRG